MLILTLIQCASQMCHELQNLQVHQLVKMQLLHWKSDVLVKTSSRFSEWHQQICGMRGKLKQDVKTKKQTKRAN